MKRKLYCAYGSNINVQQMRHRCPDAKIVGTGALLNYELTFNRVATIVPQKRAAVPVLIWAISKRDEKYLDQYEGFPHLYGKKRVTVMLHGRRRYAMAYIMNDSRHRAIPTEFYAQTIRDGYKAVQLNLSYLETAIDKVRRNSRG